MPPGFREHHLKIYMSQSARRGCKAADTLSSIHVGDDCSCDIQHGSIHTKDAQIPMAFPALEHHRVSGAQIEIRIFMKFASARDANACSDVLNLLHCDRSRLKNTFSAPYFGATV